MVLRLRRAATPEQTHRHLCEPVAHVLEDAQEALHVRGLDDHSFVVLGRGQALLDVPELREARHVVKFSFHLVLRVRARLGRVSRNSTQDEIREPCVDEIVRAPVVPSTVDFYAVRERRERLAARVAEADVGEVA